MFQYSVSVQKKKPKKEGISVLPPAKKLFSLLLKVEGAVIFRVSDNSNSNCLLLFSIRRHFRMFQAFFSKIPVNILSK